MTSTTNARELDRLRKARTDAQDRFAKQMKLLEQIVPTAAEREAITKRWHGQLALHPRRPRRVRRERGAVAPPKRQRSGRRFRPGRVVSGPAKAACPG